MEIYLILFFVVAILIWAKDKFPESSIYQQLDNACKLALNIFKQAPVSESVTTSNVNTDEQSGINTGLTTNIPEDSVLKRHYLTQLQAELDAKTAILMNESTSATPAPNPKMIPEDSVLRRHFLTEWEASFADGC